MPQRFGHLVDLRSSQARNLLGPFQVARRKNEGQCRNVNTRPAQSILGVIGGFLAPLFTPLGFGTWQAAVALLAGLVAKEAVVSSLSMFFGFSTVAGSEVIRASMAGTFTPLSAYSFLVFVLLYVPCMAAVSTMRRELGSGKWTMRMVLWQILAAYVVSLLVYQGGLLLGLG